MEFVSDTDETELRCIGRFSIQVVLSMPERDSHEWSDSYPWIRRGAVEMVTPASLDLFTPLPSLQREGRRLSSRCHHA